MCTKPNHNGLNFCLWVTAGTEIILTANHLPIARLLPFSEAMSPRVPGLHAGTVWMSADFDDPLPDEF